MPTRAETGLCATPGCNHQRVLHGVWCEVHEGAIPPERQAEAQRRQRRLARVLGVNEATLRAALAGMTPPPGLEDAELRQAAWDRAEAVLVRRRRRTARWLICAALAVLWVLWEWMG